MSEKSFIPTGSLDGGTIGTCMRKHGRPVEFEYEREARPQQLEELEMLGYQGSPIPWGYITARQADILPERLTRHAPLWQPSGHTKEPAKDPDGTPLALRVPATGKTDRRPVEIAGPLQPTLF